MYDFSIGVMLESFKLPIPEAIKKQRSWAQRAFRSMRLMENFLPAIWSVQSEKNSWTW